MNNKNIKIVLSVVVLALMAATFLGVSSFIKGSQGEKEIFITIENEETGEFLATEKSYRTDAQNLGDFLWENKDDLQVIMSDSEYGRFLEGLSGLNTENMAEGPWWMYAYDSPSQGLTMDVGNAPGVDTLGIHDGDTIHFVFTMDMGM